MFILHIVAKWYMYSYIIAFTALWYGRYYSGKCLYVTELL